MKWDFHAYDPNSNPGSTNLDQVSGELDADSQVEAEDAARAEFVAAYGERASINVAANPSLHQH